MPYSLWLMFEEDASAELGSDISALAALLGGAAFPPHLTLIGDMALGVEEAEAVAGTFRGHVPERLHLKGLRTSASYFMAVHAAVRLPNRLDRLRVETARKIHGTGVALDVPHVSLAYGTYTAGAAAAGIRHAGEEIRIPAASRGRAVHRPVRQEHPDRRLEAGPRHGALVVSLRVGVSFAFVALAPTPPTASGTGWARAVREPSAIDEKRLTMRPSEIARTIMKSGFTMISPDRFRLLLPQVSVDLRDRHVFAGEHRDGSATNRANMVKNIQSVGEKGQRQARAMPRGRCCARNACRQPARAAALPTRLSTGCRTRVRVIAVRRKRYELAQLAGRRSAFRRS